jgi:hypothetical protein
VEFLLLRQEDLGMRAKPSGERRRARLHGADDDEIGQAAGGIARGHRYMMGAVTDDCTSCRAPVT